MITPRQVSPSVQPLFAPQAERAVLTQGKKSLGGLLVDDGLLAGKRSTAALTEKKLARGTEKKTTLGGADDSFGAQLEKAVSRKPRADRDRLSVENRDDQNAGMVDQPARGERGSEKTPRRAESDRAADAQDEVKSPREDEVEDDLTIDEQTTKALAESAEKSAAVEASQVTRAIDSAVDTDYQTSSGEAEATAQGTFVRVLADAGSAGQSAKTPLSVQTGSGSQSANGGVVIDGAVLKTVTPEEGKPRGTLDRAVTRAGGDAEALSAGTLSVDANGVDEALGGASVKVGDLTSSDVQSPGGQPERASESAEAEKLIDQRAEIVSRTSRLAVLKAQPLTIDSLNELLVTIDPSLASQILRPTSLNGAAREGVVDGVKNQMLQAEPERAESVSNDGDIVERQADHEGTVRERLSESSGLAARRDASAAGDRGSINDRVFTRVSEAESSFKTASDQRRDNSVRERGAADTATSPRLSAGGGGALNVLNASGVTAGLLSDAQKGDSKTSTSGEGGAKATTIAGGAATLGNASGSATNQGTRDEQGSSLLQQGAGSGSLTDDVEGDRALNAAVASQLTRGVSTALRQRVGSMVMKLQPESLGQVRVNIDFASTTLNVRFDTASAQASHAIQSAMSELKSSLVSRGYNLGEAKVTIDPTLSDSSRTGELAASHQAAESFATGTSARASELSQATVGRGALRQSKQKSGGDSIPREGGVGDTDELLTVDARGGVVRTKLSTVG